MGQQLRKVAKRAKRKNYLARCKAKVRAAMAGAKKK